MVSMEENVEMLLRRNRMSAGEMSMTERLMRQKNTILQRQLEVSLRILDKEGRTSQKHIQSLVNEYSDFLSDLPCRWVGLDTYTQPDTKALRKKSREKKESRVSVDGSVSGSVVGKSRSPNRPKTSRISSTVAPPSPRIRPASAVVPPTSPRLRHTSASASTASPRIRPKSSATCTRELPKFNTCIEVLDDIIQNHSLRKKSSKHRRIGLVVPPSVKDNDKKDRGTVYNEATGRTVYVRPSSSIVTSVSTSTTQNRVRPHTAQPLRATVNSPNATSHWSQEEARRPQSAVFKTKRPKSAPPKYELYGRSPAVPKRTVAGIMAEMHSRRAATRDMLGKSKQLQKYISHLAWPDVQQ